MYKAFIVFAGVFWAFCLFAPAQVPVATEVKILKAEDERRYDRVLEELLEDKNPAVRTRAALAAGRIGDEKAIPALAGLLEKDPSAGVRAMAAFALGETESMLAADAVLKALTDPQTAPDVRARAVETAGKIVGANAAKGRSKMVDNLGDAILDILKSQAGLGNKQDRNTVLLGLTAALRAHARAADKGLTKEEIEAIDTGGAAARFLKNPDARIRADALNTISRSRYKKANEAIRSMLRAETDPVARANAAAALGRAEDKDAYDLLLKAATEDKDLRVRVSAIRALGSIKEAKAADRLIERGRELITRAFGQKEYPDRGEMNELLEIATTLGRVHLDSKNEKTVMFLRELYPYTKYHASEVAIAWARVDPKHFIDNGSLRVVLDHRDTVYDWRFASSQAQALGELAASKDAEIKAGAQRRLEGMFEFTAQDGHGSAIALPDLIGALAQFKPADLDARLREFLAHNDLFVRATAAGALADQPPSKENTDALGKAFNRALIMDKDYDDAQLAILDALYKVDKEGGAGSFLIALAAQDYLVRKKAIELLEDKDLQNDLPGIPTSLEGARMNHKDRVFPYAPVFGTKLGSILNKPADYTRAASRRNGQVKAVFTTSRGTFTIDLLPEDAPLTVDNFIKLAQTGYFNGVLVHRVVPNFVMQDGDPRGDGNGGPGWSIRCEINMVPYDRGAVGMALSGKDTGGSQWFVTHSPQPHLDGGYTVFGHVNETDMRVVDNIAREDTIVSVKIVERKLPQKGANGRKK